MVIPNLHVILNINGRFKWHHVLLQKYSLQEIVAVQKKTVERRNLTVWKQFTWQKLYLAHVKNCFHFNKYNIRDSAL